MTETDRRAVGLALLTTGDAAHATALLLLPLWVAHQVTPHAGYGSGLAVGPVVVVLAMALCQPVQRALCMLAGLAAALAVCALWWPLPDWTWFVAFCAGSILTAGAREFHPRVRTYGLGGAVIVVGIAGLLLVRRVLVLDEPGMVSVQIALNTLVLWPPIWLAWRLCRWALCPVPDRGGR